MKTLQDYLTECSLPQLEARMLMQHVTGFSRVSLISRSLDELPESMAQAFENLVQRRILGEPMAYIVGSREFYGRDFKVSPDVLIPRPDTETLIDWVLNDCDLSDDEPLKVLDLGTGSGAIAVTLACERPVWQVTAIDISVAALQVAAENSQRLGVNVVFYQSDWFDIFEKQSTRPKFDLIVSNPPYVADQDIHLSQGDLRFEPRVALTDGADGLTHYRFLVHTVPSYLKKGGQLWFEHGFDQGAAIRDLLNAGGFEEVFTLKDLAGNDRVSGGKLPNVC